MALCMTYRARFIQKRNTRLLVALWALIAFLLTPWPAAARVLVDVSHVGIPVAGVSDAVVVGGDVVRVGSWAPVIVDVSIEGESGFDGTLRIGQFDHDGDLCYDAIPVVLHGETGANKRYYLYVPANPKDGRLPFSLELVDADGEIVEVVCNGKLTTKPAPPQPPLPISHDHLVILEVSSEAIGKVINLVRSDQTQMYDRPLAIGHISPRDLPELWIGLEMVDCVIWKKARPEDLSPAQLSALIEWVRQGGRLLITAPRSPGSLTMSESVNELLPVDLGEVVEMTDLMRLRRRMLETPADTPYKKPIKAIKCTLRPGASRILFEDSVGDVLAERRVGQGFVTFSAVALDEMFSEDGSPAILFRRVFHLKTIDDIDVMVERTSLFNHVVTAIGFATSGSVYLFIAVLFSIAYVCAATFGSWGVLSHKKMLHHSWSLFGLVVCVMSVLSVLAVRAVLGIETKLHQVSIVDAVADERYATATVFFGLKTPADVSMDVWLPSDPLGDREPGPTRCFLRPLPAGSGLDRTGSFVDPGEYQLVPGSAEIKGVRIRATPKRLEGRWEGPLSGRFTGSIATRKASSERLDVRLTEDSYIVNDLGVELKGCYLLHSLEDLFSTERFIPQDRSDRIYAYPIGDIPADAARVPLYNRCYGPAGGEEKIFEFMGEHTLGKIQDNRWRNSFHGLLSAYGLGGTDEQARVTPGKEQEALLLLSTIGEFDVLRASQGSKYDFRPRTFSRDRLRQLDLRERLRRDSVYLIGFAEGPGPVRLATRKGDREYRIVTPDPNHSWTMYRIRIPVSAIVQKTNPGDDGTKQDSD